MIDPSIAIGRVAGMPVIISEHALETTKERLFPESRHRSRRILKKLTRRYGSEFKQVPAMFLIHGEIYVHPNVWEQVKRALDEDDKTRVIPLADLPERPLPDILKPNYKLDPAKFFSDWFTAPLYPAPQPFRGRAMLELMKPNGIYTRTIIV